MVGGLDKVIYLPAMLTQRLGYFDAEGLDVELLSEPAGVQAETALVSGQVQGAVGFYDHTLDLQVKGKSVESVVQFSQAPGEVEIVSTKAAGKVKSAKDFKGKKLGVTGLGSSTDFLTKYLLAVKNGVNVSEFTPVAVGAGPTFVAALQQGSIDAGMTTDPTVATILDKKAGKILVDMRTPEGSQAALGGPYPSSSLYMQTDWVNGHKSTVQKMVNAFVKTLKWMSTHSATAIADKMPADYSQGNKFLYATAIKSTLPMFTKDGVMPTNGPETVEKVLKAFNPTIKNAAGGPRQDVHDRVREERGRLTVARSASVQEGGYGFFPTPTGRALRRGSPTRNGVPGGPRRRISASAWPVRCAPGASDSAGRSVGSPRAIGDLLGGQGPSACMRDWRTSSAVVGSAFGQPGLRGCRQGAEDAVDLGLFGLAAAVEGAAQFGVRLQLGAQAREGERLDQVLQGTVAHRRLHGRHVPSGRHHDHVCLVATPAHLLDDRQARLVGQIVVQEDQIHLGQRLQPVERLGRAVRLGRDMEARHLLHVGRVDLCDPGVVVHDQDLDHRDSSSATGSPGAVRAGARSGSVSASGRTTTNSAPPPNASVATALPP